MSKVYSLKAVQNLPTDIRTAWQFFSNPANLSQITPPGMGFKTIGRHQGSHMYAGQVIEYKVSPLLGIPMYWMTEITHVQDEVYFIDEQRFGPYSLWHHQHHFKRMDGGIGMTDIVHYKIPYWFIGDIANSILVKNQLRQIFEFRFAKAEDIFGKWPGQEMTIEFS